jgi:two-component system chemotaxis response regulator CheB
MIETGLLKITKGPRENRFRPAIDPLFRSAAYSNGSRAIAVVLTGDLDDGTSGLWAIKERGGIAIAQDPSDAEYPSMPRSAIEHVAVDHVVPVGEVASLLAKLTALPVGTNTPERSRTLEAEVKIANGEDARQVGVMRLGQPSTYACPDCHGVLLEVKDESAPRFRCHTGHAYSLESLAEALRSGAEDAMWAAVRALDEEGSLLEQMARHLQERHHGQGAARLNHRAVSAKRRADEIRRLVADDPVHE